MHRLAPAVMHYAWGSHDVIARLTGRAAPTSQPEAELWMGAHEQAPSTVVVGDREVTLDRLLAGHPEMLGEVCGDSFEGRLPFLLKILAPRQPLSIQCHPDARQAVDAVPGTYVDRWPKPEAIMAVTEFEILAGMRPYAQLRTLADRLAVPALTAHVAGVESAPDPMRQLLTDLLSLQDTERIALVRNVVDACMRASTECGDGAAGVVSRFAHLYPDDIGLVVVLLMQHRVLTPGSYIFVPAGALHAYVGGTAVEILANSDNVVRAGLTAKPINIAELLRIVDVDAVMSPVEPTVAGRVRSYPSDAPHFQLHIVGPGATEPTRLPGTSCPRIVLALHDAITVSTPTESMELPSGGSCFISACEGPVTVDGVGEAFVATTGLEPA